MFQPGYFRVQTVYRYATFFSPLLNLTQMETERKATKERSRKQFEEFVGRLEANTSPGEAAGAQRK
jgi:hypothetical protein